VRLYYLKLNHDTGHEKAQTGALCALWCDQFYVFTIFIVRFPPPPLFKNLFMLKIDHPSTPYMRLHYDLRAPYLLHTHCTTLVCVIIFLIPIRLERDCCAKNLTGVNANYVSSHSAHHQVIRQYVEILYIFSSLSRVLFQIKKKN
jgi:hypothetical protein